MAAPSHAVEGLLVSDLLDRSAFELVFAHDFTGPLDPDRWIDSYLPHWTTPERASARYDLGADGLRLRIDADQPEWLPGEGGLRVSNLQTGAFAGPVGSPVGQMAHRDGLVVRTAVPTTALWTPSAGLVEATVRATDDPTCMLAVWLVGFKDTSERESGEVCAVELYGDAIGPDRSRVRLGIKAHQDPRLREDVHDVWLDMDATQEHTYAAEWTPGRSRYYVDDRLVRTIDQAPGYPLQLMVDLFEFPPDGERDPARYPKTATVRSVQGYRHR